MKVNDLVPVTIAGQVVANATVKEMSEGTATLVVPATLVVMAVRTELAYAEETAQDAPVEQETIITGVDQTSATVNPPEGSEVLETPSAEPSSTTEEAVVEAPAVVETTDAEEKPVE